jgi:hypothetical protein
MYILRDENVEPAVPVALRGCNRLRMKPEPGQEGLCGAGAMRLSRCFHVCKPRRSVGEGLNIPRLVVLMHCGGGDVRGARRYVVSNARFARDDGIAWNRVLGYWYVWSALALRRRLSGLPCALSTPTSPKKYPCGGDEFRDAGPLPHLV